MSGGSGHLKREIGLIGLTFIGVGGVFGSGWLFAPLLAAVLAEVRSELQAGAGEEPLPMG